MKILHIITALNNGGAEGVLYRLCTNSQNHRHIVVSMMDNGYYGPLLKSMDVDVYCLNMPQGKITIGGVIKLFNLLRDISPDVVQTWMYHADLIGGVIAKIAGVKSIYWNVRHTTLEPGKSKKSTILIAKICATVSGWITKNIIYCAHEAKVVHENLGYIKGRSTVIGNGYDLTKLVIDEPLRSYFRREVGAVPGDVLIGMVGRFNPQKDHATLIGALGTIKKLGYSFKAVLIGRGVDSSNKVLMKNLLDNDLIDQVLMLGQRSDITAVMNGLDLHVLSSSFGEGFPNVLAEAMACGTPCVTTNIGDSGLIVDKAGWIVQPHDPKILADSIIEAMIEKESKPHAWLQRKSLCRSRVLENFNIHSMVAAYHEVWFK